MHALSYLEASTGTIISERVVLFNLNMTQKVTFKTFVIGKLVADAAVKTVSEADRVLFHASKFLKYPRAMSPFVILK